VTSGPALDAAFHQALRELELQALYDKAPCGYLTTTLEGEVVRANQTLARWLGREPTGLVGTMFTDLLTGGGRIYHETHYRPLLVMQGEAHEIALELVRSDGSRLPVLLNANVEHDGDSGEPVAVHVAVFDATQRRAYEQELLAAKERAEASEVRARALAQQLQATFVPPSPPTITGLEVATCYRPAGDGSEVGGDFFDVFEVAEDDWVVVLGDVAGKGVAAAAVTALVRHSVRALAVRQAVPSRLLAELNRVLLAQEIDRFCTLVVLRLRRTTDGWLVAAASAGHPMPVLVRSGAAPQTWGAPGTLVGLLEDVEHDDASTRLCPGDALVLYTDGVTEGRRGRELYGEGRLLTAADRHRGTAATLAGGVLADVLEFQGDMARDDIAVLVVQAADA
jgi:sigma-B regulation protein RsbU (phosphoserine phosphatase)